MGQSPGSSPKWKDFEAQGLSIDTNIGGDGKDLIRSLAGALPGSQGIEDLRVTLLIDESDEMWSLFLRSLWAHPRIQFVGLYFRHRLSVSSKTSMNNAVLRLAQCNTVVHTMNLATMQKTRNSFRIPLCPG
jgi:hypothetical protein